MRFSQKKQLKQFLLPVRILFFFTKASHQSWRIHRILRESPSSLNELLKNRRNQNGQNFINPYETWIVLKSYPRIKKNLEKSLQNLKIGPKSPQKILKNLKTPHKIWINPKESRKISIKPQRILFLKTIKTI